MGKASAEQAAATKQKIIDVALTLSLKVGFDKATFVKIAKEVPMSASGINTHFPRKSDLARELRPLLQTMLYEKLNFESPELFYDSWVHALNNDESFQAIMIALGPIDPPHIGMPRLRAKIKGEQAKPRDYANMAIGYSVEHISAQIAQQKKQG